MMMKHVVSFALLGFGLTTLGGCPIYSHDDICVGRECLVPGDDVPGGAICTKPSDCPAGTNCGADARCHGGDCSTTGCPTTFVCKLSGGTPRCVPVGTGPDAGDAGGGGDAGVHSVCSRDSDCPTPVGSKCLTGACVAPQDQCADATQCPAGGQCVQGACTPVCNAGKPCPSGYACDEAKGVCTGNSTVCTDTSSCASFGVSQAICVQQHCVDPCGPGGTCAAGLVCLDGGCSPDQRPVFTCSVDGAQSDCQAQSICLRHSCYIGCDPDAGAEGCKSADKFNVCKPVTTASGVHSVCGSADNLGSECDPTQGKNCSTPLICIDGFCR